MAYEPYPWRLHEVQDYFRLPRETRRRHLERRVLDTVHGAWKNVPQLAETWEAAGLHPSDITSLDDLGKLPTTSIQDMRRSIEDRPPFGRHWDTTQLEDVSVVMTTGGTTGPPRPVLITPQDQVAITDVAARVWEMTGIGHGDTVQITATFSTHGAAWIASWSLDRVGATVVPASSATTTPSIRQLDFLTRFGVTAMYCTATYSRILAATARERDINPADLKIRKIVGAGEVLSAAMRRKIETDWDAKLYDMYGTMETMGWSSVDCEASRESGGELGSHIWDDAIVIEVLDAEGNACEPGVYGDMTVTSWLSSIGPKVRYRMGDQVAIVTDPCPCGLDTPRMLPVAGRVDDMLRIAGQNVWPSAVEALVRQWAPGVGEYVAVAERDDKRDTLHIQLEIPESDPDGDRVVETLQREFKAAVGVGARVERVAPGATASLTGAGKELKVRRVFDHRRS
jgi:phenylacetate-CoA ligase